MWSLDRKVLAIYDFTFFIFLPECLARQLPGCQGAGVGEGAVRLAIHITLLLPILKVPQNLDAYGILHPLDNLQMLEVDDKLIVNAL